MTEKVVKEGFALAEEEMRKKQTEEVKRIVLKTLEKLKELEKVRDDANKKIKILKMDIEDLKEGKLDRIVERQEKDAEAKNISVVTIIKEEHHHYNNPWYVPYQIIWHQPLLNTVFGSVHQVNQVPIWSETTYASANMITCSSAKDAAVGTYTVEGEIVHLR